VIAFVRIYLIWPGNVHDHLPDSIPKLRKIKLVGTMHLICFVLNDVQQLVNF